MPVAITLGADDAGAAALEKLRNAVAAFETAPSMATLGYAPHLTLGLYQDGDDLKAVLPRLAAGNARIVLRFAALRWFDGPPLTIWAAPAESDALDALHRRLHSKVAAVRCDPHYRPGAWVPHATLGNQIATDREPEARAFAASWGGPVDVTFDRLEIVSFPPVRIDGSVALSG